MFAITVDSPRWSESHVYVTNDPFGWLDRAYGITPDLVVLSVVVV